MADEEPVINADKTVSMGTSAAAGAVAGTAVMPGWGTAIGAGIGLIGGALSNRSSENQAEKGYSAQERSLRNSIRWRVEDAKAAGIHPLYALGAPAMSTSPMMYEDKIGPAVQNMGQAMPDILRGKQSEYETVMQFENYRNMASLTAKNDAEAFYYRALAEVTLQKRNSVNPVPGMGVQHEMGQDPKGAGEGIIDLKPAEQISTKAGHPESSAGINPAYQLRMIDKNLPAFMPIAEGDSPEETIGEMSPAAFGGLVLRNTRIFGGQWLQDFIGSRYLGIEPKGEYSIKDPGPKRKPTKDYFGRPLKPERR